MFEKAHDVRVRLGRKAKDSRSIFRIAAGIGGAIAGLLGGLLLGRRLRAQEERDEELANRIRTTTERLNDPWQGDLFARRERGSRSGYAYDYGWRREPRRPLTPAERIERLNWRLGVEAPKGETR